MPEGLSVSEVGKEIAEHAPKNEHKNEHEDDGNSEDHTSRTMSIVEAMLLAVVAVLAAYSGFASSKWGTESSSTFPKAATVSNFASRAQLQGLERRTSTPLPSTHGSRPTWTATWRQDVAEHRFRPHFLVAFNAWIATDPFSNVLHRKVRPTCPSISNRSRPRRSISTTKLTTCTAKAPRTGRTPTTTSEPLSSWPQCCS